MKAGSAATPYTDAVSAIRHIENATTASVLFGIDPEKTYRVLAQLCHPDKLATQPAAMQKRGNDAFAKLSQMYATLNGKTAPVAPVVFGKWVVEHPITSGDIADLYQITSTTHKRAVLKIARSHGDNDLMDREISALKKLHGDTRSDKFKHYIPQPIDSFKASNRRAVVLNYAESELREGGFEPMVSLEQITSIKGKLDMRHVVWMSNRILSALGFIHNNGIVHGAIVPPHLMYGPLSHTLMLVDWCYSVDAAALTHIPAIVKNYKSWYPREVLRKDKPTPATDIFMWAMMVRNTAENIPARFKGLLDWCLADSPKTRLQSAWDVQDKWGKLAQEEFGKPRYLKLTL